EVIVQEELLPITPVLNKPETNEEEQEEPLQNPNPDDGPTINEVQTQDEATHKSVVPDSEENHQGPAVNETAANDPPSSNQTQSQHDDEEALNMAGPSNNFYSTLEGMPPSARLDPIIINMWE
ncbi:hypothetical protein, partial [Serratia marcescens]|uniref:hypothetical protein n=1 Tax=Serratia marcescens TaxID=615 RepID=UPI002812FE79